MEEIQRESERETMETNIALSQSNTPRRDDNRQRMGGGGGGGMDKRLNRGVKLFLFSQMHPSRKQVFHVALLCRRNA